MSPFFQSFCAYSMTELLNQTIIRLYFFEELPYCTISMAAPFCIHSSQAQRSNFSTSSPTCYFLFVFIIAVLMGVRRCLVVVLTRISLKVLLSVYSCAFGHLYVFLEQRNICLSLIYSLSELSGFLLLSFRKTLHILDINALPYI